MKTMAFITSFALMALLLPVLAFGNPFLVCDPQEGVTYYDLEINGTMTEGIPAEADGSIKYDLAGITEGDYTVRARCYNLWEVSDWSLPLDFTKAVPGKPTSLRVSSE